jgi:RNA polymerase sigma-70 factor (ECF subfamily)
LQNNPDTAVEIIWNFSPFRLYNTTKALFRSLRDKWMIEEISVIRTVLGGDVDSFRLLVQRYQGPVIRMIKNIIDDHHTCEDIAQDVFLTAYKKLPSFDPARSSFSTWLFTIARNKSLNALKRKRILSMSSLPENPDSSTLADSLTQKEFFNQLDKVLQTLPSKQKTAFVLAEFEKLPYEQIAQIEGVRIGTIKSRINRAKKKLKSALKNLEEDSV